MAIFDDMHVFEISFR